jgi:hypothetical protein
MVERWVLSKHTSWREWSTIKTNVWGFSLYQFASSDFGQLPVPRRLDPQLSRVSVTRCDSTSHLVIIRELAFTLVY